MSDELDDSAEMLSREDKPYGWEPIPEAELEELRRAVADAARSKAVPLLQETLNKQTAERNGESKVPRDPVERAGWARRVAVEHGWSNREAGDES